MTALNSNVAFDLKWEVVVWSKLRMRSEKRQNRQKASPDG